MKALFCHDNVYVHGDAERVYSEGQFAYAHWRRYLTVFSSLVVVARGRPLASGEARDRLNVASGERVSFITLPHFASLTGVLKRRSEAVARLSAAISAADAVIVRLPSEIGLLAARLSGQLGKPLAVELVTCAWDALWNYGTWQASLYAPVQTWRVRRAVWRAPFTIYVTEDFLQRRYPTSGRPAVASNVEIDLSDPVVLSRRLKRIRQPRKHLVLGLIGSLQHRYKGVQTALDALARVRDQLPPFEFRVLGPGAARPWQREVARRGLEDRVRFCGILPSGPPVLAWLDEIDLYLQPSFQEGLPRALIEAMSRGCPALGSTAGGIPETVAGKLSASSWCSGRPRPSDPPRGKRTDWQAVQAERKITVAKRYTNDTLGPRRLAFWRGFADYAGRQAKLPCAAPWR